jgi:hypothetical protein
MSEAIQKLRSCIQNDPDILKPKVSKGIFATEGAKNIIKDAGDMVSEKLTDVVYQLNPHSTMTTEDYNYIRS